MTNTLGLKEFELKQLDWWCNYYRVALRDMALRAKQLVDGEISPGIVGVFAKAVIDENKERDNLV